VTQQADATLIAREGILERQIAGFHFLDNGLELGDRRFERLGGGCRLWHGSISGAAKAEK